MREVKIVKRKVSVKCFWCGREGFFESEEHLEEEVTNFSKPGWRQRQEELGYWLDICPTCDSKGV